MLAVGTLLLLLTLSKGGWLGWGVGSGVFLVLVLKRRWRVLLLGAAIGLSVIGAVLMARGAQRDSLSRRVLTWRAAGQAVAHRPIVGAGLLNNHVHRAFLRPEDGERITTSEEWDLLLGHSHNLLLQVGEGLGFLGIALMGWLVVSAVLSGRAAWVVSGAGGRPVVAGILGGLAGHLATSMFLVGYSTPTLLAVEAAALLALLSDGGERTRSRGRMLLIPLGLLVLLLTRGETHRLAAEQARRHDNIAGLLSEAKAWASVSPWAASPRAEVGRTFLREGQLDEAAEWLAAAVARSKLYAPYRVSLAEAYRRQGRWLDAMRELEAAVELDPAYTQPQGGLAARVELQSLNKARGDDGALRTVGPMGERGEREARLATATALLESGKKAAAMAILQTLLKESQSDVERYRAAMLLASAQERLRRPGQAMQTYRLAASINDGPEPREAMGRLHLDAGRVSRAVKELELAVAAGAGSDAHARLAQALEMSGDLNRGLWAAREAVRLSPTSGRARSMLGRLLFLSGAAGRAVAELEAAARLDTLSAKPLVLLAEVHRKEKDLAKALQAASDAVAREPELPWAHKQKAFTLQGMGRNEEAVAAWREAVRLDTGDTEAHYFLALALEGTGATAEMREELLLYLEMEPDGRWAERAQDLLGSGG
jgi:tetratricopeptide (TPR) repeat protein